MKRINHYVFDFMILTNVLLFPFVSVDVGDLKFLALIHPLMFAIIYCIFMFFFFRQIGSLFELYQKNLSFKIVKMGVNSLILLIFGSLIITIPYMFSHHPDFQKIYTISQEITFIAYILGLLFAMFGFIEGKTMIFDKDDGTSNEPIEAKNNFSSVVKLVLFLYIPWLIFSGYVSYWISTIINISVIDTILAIVTFVALFAALLYITVIFENSKVTWFIEKTKTIRQFGEQFIINLTLNLWDNVFYLAYKETFGIIGLCLTGLLPLRLMMLFSPSKKGIEFVIGIIVLIIYLVRGILI
ncbi:MAG: hypothetical protein N2449_10040 [Bacteroidales bacterium]|nr:hypothetical protein [Bacteroidales bacterium]